MSVTHKFGTTVIEQEPTRVVSAGYTEHDTLLSLGVIPVDSLVPQLAAVL